MRFVDFKAVRLVELYEDIDNSQLEEASNWC
jgi:hypothetical protein